jgi:hypothetical protein
MLLIIAIVLASYACLVQKATCFCPSGHKKFTSHSQHRQNKVGTPSTSHQLALSSQDEVLHGRYNTIITTTNHLSSSKNNNRWIGSLDPSLSRRSNSTSSQAILLHPINNNSLPPPIEAIHAIEATYRWATNFVRGLNLCPWAGASIDNPGAICYWVLLIDEDDDRREEEVDVLDKMEEIIREAGVQLTLATTSSTTNSDDHGHITIDPSVAISFVILAPKTAAAGKETTNYYHHLPSFENFHEFFIDLEDRLLDECDDYWDSIGNENEETEGEHCNDDNNVNSSILGCDITIAAFHPKWQFNGGSEDGELDDDDDNSNIVVHPIDYEKRTPYPTISIVMSSVIDSLMKEREEGDTNNGDSSSAPVTERIADLNEKTLCAIGAKRLKEIFDKDVLECPGRDAQ